MEKSKYTNIGLFRFILALLVFCAHSKGIFTFFPSYFDSGAVAVYLFFCVSGFIVAYALENFYKDKCIQFLKNRALRLYPVYAATYIISVLILLIIGVESLNSISISGLTVIGVIKAATIIGAYMDLHAMGPNGVSWSIVVEAIFYAAIGLTPLVLGKFLGVPRSMMVLLAGSLALFAAVVIIPNGSIKVHGIFKFTPFFALGVATFYASVSKSAKSRILVGSKLVLSLFWILCSDSYTYSGLNGKFVDHVVNAGVFLLSFTILMLLIAYSIPAQLRAIDQWLGDLTYPIYMVHTPLLAVFMYLLPHSNGFMWWLFAFSLTLAAAALLHLGVERPFIRIRNRLRGCEIAAEQTSAPVNNRCPEARQESARLIRQEGRHA